MSQYNRNKQVYSVFWGPWWKTPPSCIYPNLENFLIFYVVFVIPFYLHEFSWKMWWFSEKSKILEKNLGVKKYKNKNKIRKLKKKFENLLRLSRILNKVIMFVIIILNWFDYYLVNKKR